MSKPDYAFGNVRLHPRGNGLPHLAMDAALPRRRIARDETMSVDDCLAVIKIMLANLPPEDGAQLLAGLKDMAATGAPEMAVNLDNPPPFPGRPRTGGAMDGGRPWRRHAPSDHDGFLRRNPGASRILYGG